MTTTFTPDGGAVRFVRDGRMVTRVCRACHAEMTAPVYAHVAAAQRAEGFSEWTICPSCGSAGAVDLQPPTYEVEVPQSPASIKYYVEQGAAIDVLANLIAGVTRVGPTRILDVGCSFGFLLDYSRTARGWEPQGIDPSSFAAAGREALGLPIASEYLTDENAAAFASDVIVCSELIEHLPDPDPFLATMMRTLKPGGALVLTTPSSSGVQESAGQDRHILAHGPGQHIVVYSPRGLESALRRAGFAHAEVVETSGGVHLLAAASMDAASIDLSKTLDRTGFREWLRRRADTVSDLALETGLRGRLLKLSVAAGAWDEARDAAKALGPCFLKAGFDLSQPDLIQPPQAPDFTAFAMLAPCNTGAMLFQLGCLAEQDDDIARAEKYYRASIRFGSELNRHLNAVAALDLETSGQIVAAAARAAAMRAARDPQGAAGELASLGAAAFEPGACSPFTFLHIVGGAMKRELDITPLEQACVLATEKAEGYAPGRLWLTMAMAAFARSDAVLALRSLRRIPDGETELAADKRRLTDEAAKRLLITAVGDGRMEDAAWARSLLSQQLLAQADIAVALGLVALNHDRDPTAAAALFARSPEGAELREEALAQAFITTVAAGKLDAGRAHLAAMKATTQPQPRLQLARGLLALNGDNDPAAAAAFFAASPEPAANAFRALAERRAFVDHVLHGDFDKARPYRDAVESALVNSPEPGDADAGRVWAALALYEHLAEGNAQKADTYAQRARAFDLDDGLRTVLKDLKRRRGRSPAGN